MSRPDIHVDVHLVLLREGRILMGERRNTAFASGEFHVPAGRLEVDETIVDGLIREALEETGIALAPDDIDLVYVMHFRGKSDRLSLFFTAARWSGEIENREPDKCVGWAWVPIDALPANTVPYARKAIADIVAGKRLGVFGW
jgi:8-oxo-dGTP diphosphatase